MKDPTINHLTHHDLSRCIPYMRKMEKENIKLGIAIVTTGLIGRVAWKFRKKIVTELGEFFGAVLKGYTEYNYEKQYYYTRVKGHWRLDYNGNLTYVKPHYRKTWKRRY